MKKPTQGEFLARLDQKMDDLKGHLERIEEDNTEQFKVLHVHSDQLTKHGTYFKVMGWVLGSGTAVTVIVNGAMALLK
jgi:hypothetical protein